MDVIGSILKSMDKPPMSKTTVQENRQRKLMQQQQMKQKEKLRKFREKVEEQLNTFLQSEDTKLQFDPMEKVQRTIVHEVADVACVPAYSFGEEGVDRHVILWKPNSPPCEQELQCLRKGEEYIPGQVLEKPQEKEEDVRPIEHKEPASNYKQKYEHIIGKESAKEAARLASTNLHYGFVPSANKKDARTIEQTLADIQARKKQRTE